MTNVFGYKVLDGEKEQVVRSILHQMKNTREALSLVCLNHYALLWSRVDEDFGKAIRDADFVITDGVFAKICAWLAGSRSSRITGYDLFVGLNRLLNREGGYTCFFLGSTERVLRRLIKRFRRRFPAVEVAGYYAPAFMEDFDEEESRRMLEVVNRAEADILWVGIAQPKQEKWIYRNKRRLGVRLACAVGAVFEFFALTERRAPTVFRDAGLEWLWRCFTKPQRTLPRLIRPSISFLR
ncbi:MAG: glycosyltransferase [Planctomycetota bacterium]|nr:MAG: glycosyltransferase [Planctomycetota bacterium]